MRLRTVGHLTAEAVRSVQDNGLLSVAAMSTVAVSLLVLAVISLLALNMQHLTRVMDAKVQVVAYFSTKATPAQASAAVAQLRALPHVTRVKYVSRAAALRQLANEFGRDKTLLRQVETHNPLPDSADVYVDKTIRIAGVVRAMQKVPGVASVHDAQAVVNKLTNFTRAVRYLGLFLVSALALATVIVIGNTVRVAVYARREQIGIMKLVGATNGFIRWPFFIEGAILGLGGAALSGAVVWWGYRWLNHAVAALVPFLPLLAPTRLLPHLVETLLASGLLLGALGSAISVRRHLNV